MKISFHLIHNWGSLRTLGLRYIRFIKTNEVVGIYYWQRRTCLICNKKKEIYTHLWGRK